MKRNQKVKQGIVISNKMTKTITISVERRSMDRVFKKIVKQVNKLQAHDEMGECQVGDHVQLIETKPISKNKSWRVQKILLKAVSLDIEKAS